jgi:hypothetical protein
MNGKESSLWDMVFHISEGCSRSLGCGEPYSNTHQVPFGSYINSGEFLLAGDCPGLTRILSRFSFEMQISYLKCRLI